jgi:hypothetical protein
MRHQLKKDLIDFLKGINLPIEDRLRADQFIQTLTSELEYFPVTHVSREDITDETVLGTKIPKQGIEITDSEMERIADKMGDAYCEHSYWIDLEIIAEHVLEDKLIPFEDTFEETDLEPDRHPEDGVAKNRAE